MLLGTSSPNLWKGYQRISQGSEIYIMTTFWEKYVAILAHSCKDNWLLSPGQESDQVVTRMPLSLNKETRGITGQGKVEPRSFIRVNLEKEKSSVLGIISSILPDKHTVWLFQLGSQLIEAPSPLQCQPCAPHFLHFEMTIIRAWLSCVYYPTLLLQRYSTERTQLDKPEKSCQ